MTSGNLGGEMVSTLTWNVGSVSSIPALDPMLPNFITSRNSNYIDGLSLQFFHEIKHCDQGLKTVTSRLRHDGKKEQKERRDVQSFIREVRVGSGLLSSACVQCRL